MNEEQPIPWFMLFLFAMGIVILVAAFAHPSSDPTCPTTNNYC